MDWAWLLATSLIRPLPSSSRMAARASEPLICQQERERVAQRHIQGTLQQAIQQALPGWNISYCDWQPWTENCGPRTH